MLGDLLSLCFNIKYDGYPFLIHALASITPYAACLVTDRYVAFSAAALIAESSTLLLNGRLMMIQLGRGKGAAFEAVQVRRRVANKRGELRNRKYPWRCWAMLATSEVSTTCRRKSHSDIVAFAPRTLSGILLPMLHLRPRHHMLPSPNPHVVRRGNVVVAVPSRLPGVDIDCDVCHYERVELDVVLSDDNDGCGGGEEGG